MVKIIKSKIDIELDANFVMHFIKILFILISTLSILMLINPLTFAQEMSTSDKAVGKPNIRTPEEAHAWRLYNQYKETQKRVQERTSRIRAINEHLASYAYSNPISGAAGLLTEGDTVANRNRLREENQQEEQRLRNIESAWDKNFGGYYGSITEVNRNIEVPYIDPKDPLHIKKQSMDLIEFRLRSFPLSERGKAPSQTVKKTGDGKITDQKTTKVSPGDIQKDERKPPLPPKEPILKHFSLLTKKEKADLFSDLCRRSCNPTVGGGSMYDAARGCVCSGVLGGKWTVPMASSGDDFNSATKAAGVKPGSADEPVKNINKAWAEYYLKMAKDLIEDIWTALPGLSLGKTSKAGTPETLKERVERKLSDGDIGKAEAYTKTAIEMYPPVESVAKAVITGLPWRLEKLALSFVPSLDFGTSTKLLDKAVKLDEKSPQFKNSLSRVKQWEREWNQIKDVSKNCFALIEAKRVCECQRLFDGKIEPLNNSFRIWTGGTYDRGLEDGRTVKELTYLPIPEKDALRSKLLLQLDNSRRLCRYQPGLDGPVGVLEAYIADRARPGRTDQTIADMAKKVLERKGLCDCEHELAEKALRIADKWIAEQGRPLKVSLQATKTVIEKGASVELTPTISGGNPPYYFSYFGYWAFDVTGGAITGQGQTTTSLRAKITGAHPLDISVTDAKGQKTSGSIVLNVIEDTASKPTGETTKDDTTKKAASTKVGRSRIITHGSKPENASHKLMLKIPQGEQSPTLLFTYEHRVIQTGEMQYMYPPPSATTFMIEPSNSGASVARISNPAKWGDQKLFAVSIDRNVKPGTKFTLTAYYSGIYLPQGATSKYIDTGEDTEEHLKKHIPSATAVIEVISGKLTSDNGIIRIEGAAKPPSAGYDPRTDRGTPITSKTEDLEKVNKIAADFQKGQWHIMDQKEQKIKDQPPGQPQPPEYLGSSTTTTPTTEHPGDTTTPTTEPPGGSTTPTTEPPGGSTTPTTEPPSGKSTPTKVPPGVKPTPTTTSPTTTNAIYINQTKEIAHIFTEGETFASNNRLAPGEKRNVQVKPLKDGRIKFYAGRNGKVIASKYWPGTGGDPSRYPMVKFVIGMGGKEELVITTNLK